MTINGIRTTYNRAVTDRLVAMHEEYQTMDNDRDKLFNLLRGYLTALEDAELIDAKQKDELFWTVASLDK